MYIKPLENRIEYIDHYKGIAIYLVVVGHFIQYNLKEYYNNNIFEWIYSYHMPLFMFISGYICHTTTSIKIFENYYTYILKKIRTLLLPFFIWAFIILIIEGNTDKHIYITRIIELCIEPQTGLWYLYFIFLLNIQYSISLYLERWKQQKHPIIQDLIIIIINYLLFFTIKKIIVIPFINSYILYFTFFLFGVIVSKYKHVKQIILTKYVLIISLLAFSSTSISYNYKDESLYNMIIKIISSSSAIVILYYYVVINTKKNKITSQFIEFGKKTIVIYTTHYLILKIVEIELLNYNNYQLTIISSIISLAIIYTCLLIYKIINNNRAMKLLLFGIKSKTLKLKIDGK